MELLLVLLVGGGLIWALVWAANGRDKKKEDNNQ